MLLTRASSVGRDAEDAKKHAPASGVFLFSLHHIKHIGGFCHKLLPHENVERSVRLVTVQVKVVGPSEGAIAAPKEIVTKSGGLNHPAREVVQVIHPPTPPSWVECLEMQRTRIQLQ